MVKKEKLLQKQIDKLHFDESREVPAPVHPKLMPSIAQDARDLMFSAGSVPPPHGLDSFEDTRSFFDRSVTEGLVVSHVRPPQPLWKSLPRTIGNVIQSEFFIIFLRIIIIILNAVSIAYEAKLLRKPDATYEACDDHTSIIFCIVWFSIALTYSCSYFMVPFSRELSLLPALRKRGILIADCVGLMLTAVSAAEAWESYNSWHCDSGPTPLRVTRLSGNTAQAVRCGRSDNCSNIKSAAIVTILATIFWLAAFIVTFNQIGRRKPLWVSSSSAVKTWEL